MKSRITISFVSSTLVIILLFGVAEILAHTYTEEIAYLIKNHSVLGQLIFVLMAALAVIIPLWSNLFLLPFGVIMWGSLSTALLCILGWWMGSMISFFIARRYKKWLITKYPSFVTHEFVDTLISTKYENLSLIFLRMTLPVDILSYALGLFSKRISWKQNAVTTLVGITPFAFMFSFMTIFPPKVQGSILLFTSALFIIYIFVQKSKICP